MVRHLWVWEFAGLWPGGQKGGPGATRGGASVYGFERGGDVGPLRRRVHDGGGDAAVSALLQGRMVGIDRKSTRLNSSHITISYAVFCLKKKKKARSHTQRQNDKNTS